MDICIYLAAIQFWNNIFVKLRRLHVSWYKVINFGQKTLLLELIPLVVPSHFVMRVLQGLHRSYGGHLIVVMVLHILLIVLPIPVV